MRYLVDFISAAAMILKVIGVLSLAFGVGLAAIGLGILTIIGQIWVERSRRRYSAPCDSAEGRPIEFVPMLPEDRAQLRQRIAEIYSGANIADKLMVIPTGVNFYSRITPPEDPYEPLFI